MQIEDKKSNIKPIPGRRIVVSYIVTANHFTCMSCFFYHKGYPAWSNLAQSAINLIAPTKCSSCLTILSQLSGSLMLKSTIEILFHLENHFLNFSRILSKKNFCILIPPPLGIWGIQFYVCLYICWSIHQVSGAFSFIYVHTYVGPSTRYLGHSVLSMFIHMLVHPVVLHLVSAQKLKFLLTKSFEILWHKLIK